MVSQKFMYLKASIQMFFTECVFYDMMLMSSIKIKILKKHSVLL